MLHANVDYLTLVACSLLLLAVATHWLRRRKAGGGWPMAAACALIAVTLAGGFVAVQRSGEEERARLTKMLLSFAPTYAQELAQLGHAGVTFETPSTDPTYLALIEAEKRWIAVNPEVADIYTLRKRVDEAGKEVFAFVVDSETDYDRDGDFIDEREERTVIGEEYEDEDGSLAAAWAGRSVVSPEPVVDRWGTWISATVPMRDPASGKVEAVCGVDYPAQTWVAHIAGARREAIGFVAVLVALTGGAGVVASLQRARVVELRLRIAERERAADALAAAKEQADAANVAKSAFLANMSHELRTPLTAVLGFADLLREPGISTEQRLEWANTIRRNGNHLLNVINDILDLSKIEAGKLSLETMSVSPAHVVEEVASLMRVRASDRGLSLRVHAPPDTLPPRVLLDPTRLRQVLMNLVGNAIKFTQSGSVTIVAKYAAGDGDGAGGASRGGVMTFDVIDTGIGMSAEVVEKLFQPFEQGDVSTTRKYGGTGLGLTISRRLADLMGGGVRVRSTPGSGSTFTLELPVQLAPAEYGGGGGGGGGGATATQAYAPAGVRLNGVRVLLAEDSAENARLIAYHLEAAGAEYIALAGNGVEASRAISAAQASRPFDVVLMDMQMPVMDGYEATRHVRQAGFAGAIVALTANAMGGDKEKCLAAGCDDYAVKPIDAPRLIEMIRRHADRVGAGKAFRRSA